MTIKGQMMLPVDCKLSLIVNIDEGESTESFVRNHLAGKPTPPGIADIHVHEICVSGIDGDEPTKLAGNLIFDLGEVAGIIHNRLGEYVFTVDTLTIDDSK